MAGDLDADAGTLEQLGSKLAHERLGELVEEGDLVIELEDPAGQGLQGDPGRTARVPEAGRVRAPRGAGADELHAG